MQVEDACKSAVFQRIEDSAYLETNLDSGPDAWLDEWKLIGQVNNKTESIPFLALSLLLADFNTLLADSQQARWLPHADSYAVCLDGETESDWFPFLASLSDQGLTLTGYSGRHQRIVFREDDHWIQVGARQWPGEWRVSSDGALKGFVDNGRPWFGCGWRDFFRASELACRWIAERLTEKRASENLGSGIGDPFALQQTDAPENSSRGHVAFASDSDFELREEQAVGEPQSLPIAPTDNFIQSVEGLFTAILTYSNAKRNSWSVFSEATQVSFFPPIFRAAYDLMELSGHQKDIRLADLEHASDAVSRGLAIAADVAGSLVVQFPQGIGTVCGVICAPYEPGKPVPAPDLHLYLSPLKLALGLVGSSIGQDVSEESWWKEPSGHPDAGEFEPFPMLLQRVYAANSDTAHQTTDHPVETAGQKSNGEPPPESTNEQTPSPLASGPAEKCSRNLKPWNSDFADAADEYIEACVEKKEHLAVGPWLHMRCTRKLGKNMYSAGYVSRVFSDNHDHWFPRLRQQLTDAGIPVKERTRKRTRSVHRLSDWVSFAPLKV